MKKTLLATAIATAVAASGAQAATVYNQEGTKLDIYGNIQIAYLNTDTVVFAEDTSGETVKTVGKSEGIGDNGTTFGFAAEHVIMPDVVGYLKLELDDIKADEMATATDAEDSGDTAYIGVRGNFGDVRLGSYDQLIDDWIQDPITNYEAFAVSDSTVVHGKGGEQQEDKLTYTSPTWSGLQFALGTQFRGESEEELEPNESSAQASFFGGAKYTVGGFSIAAVYDNIDTIQFTDANGDVDSVGDQYGVTAQYTIDTLRLAAKVERYESDVSDDLDTNFYGVSARYGYGGGMGDVYGAYQYVDVNADSFRRAISDFIDPDVDVDTGDDTRNEVLIGATYNISDAMYVWGEAAWYDREDNEDDGFGVGVTYLF